MGHWFLINAIRSHKIPLIKFNSKKDCIKGFKFHLSKCCTSFVTGKVILEVLVYGSISR